MLSQLDLGPSGVVFLLETTGPNDGMVVAGSALPDDNKLVMSRYHLQCSTDDMLFTAAIDNASLPIFDALDLEGTVSYMPRYPAQDYPREINPLISELSVALLDGKESWSEVGEGTALLRVNKTGILNNYSSFAVRTSLLVRFASSPLCLPIKLW
mmetsp:Transcript_21103/g.33081  ORF Transcript_21103/g.33081 Transcript_21103/m.33081 type:complete len:155 (+) Transcript_21103:109-573(+)